MGTFGYVLGFACIWIAIFLPRKLGEMIHTLSSLALVFYISLPNVLHRTSATTSYALEWDHIHEFRSACDFRVWRSRIFTAIPGSSPRTHTPR